MPILKHAKKKLRQDKVRTVRNKKLKDMFKKLVKAAKVEKTPDALSKAFSSVDKATKNHLMHPNKAARMKSSLAKFVASDKTLASTLVKKAKKKVAPKKGVKPSAKTTKAKAKKTVSKKK